MARVPSSLNTGGPDAKFGGGGMIGPPSSGSPIQTMHRPGPGGPDAKHGMQIPPQLQQSWQQMAKVVNHHISFGDGVQADNIDGVWQTATTPVLANTDFTVVHNLGRIPVGVDLKMKNNPCDVYTGSVPATKTEITLRATGPSVTVSLFIH